MQPSPTHDRRPQQFRRDVSQSRVLSKMVSSNSSRALPCRYCHEMRALVHCTHGSGPHPRRLANKSSKYQLGSNNSQARPRASFHRKRYEDAVRSSRERYGSGNSIPATHQRGACIARASLTQIRRPAHMSRSTFSFQEKTDCISQKKYNPLVWQQARLALLSSVLDSKIVEGSISRPTEIVNPIFARPHPR